jgi:Xaa-Pro aminopeptidase
LVEVINGRADLNRLEQLYRVCATMSYDTSKKPATQGISEPSPAKPATHDTKPPPALLEFMLKRWKPTSSRLPPTIRQAATFKARRRALSKLFPGETLIVPTGHEKVRANDTVFRFRPGSDFYYLTGNLEPDGVLLMTPKAGGGHHDVLFVEPNPGRTDATFFTDRAKGELWVGPRLGVEQSRQRFGVDECRGLPELLDTMKAIAQGSRPWRLLRDIDERIDATIAMQAERDGQLAAALSEMRLIKDRVEIGELRAAIASTKRGFEDVIGQLAEGGTERHVEGVFNLRARVEGNEVGYGTIAASGANACILHWTRNDGPLKKGELLLLDAGVEGRSLYTADVTRTLPVSGKFTREQREIYQLVLDAQRAAIRAVKPGNDFLEPNRQAMRVLANGLERLGILSTSAEEALREENQFYKRYTLHNVSHMLGLDVHDCAKARQEEYKLGKLRPGMVLTVEPGLYFQKDDLTVPTRYRGIGIRIEDDVLVTQRGCRNLSQDFPIEAKEVEAWMAKVWKSRRR